MEGDLTEGFLYYEFGGLIFGGAYTWRGLFSEFYGIERGPSKTTFAGFGCRSRAEIGFGRLCS